MPQFKFTREDGLEAHRLVNTETNKVVADVYDVVTFQKFIEQTPEPEKLVKIIKTDKGSYMGLSNRGHIFFNTHEGICLSQKWTFLPTIL